ncbi:ValS protein [Plasmodium coatneyi]|uniref:valine--tRNA ligase n=1 Tax=Plasmodium coatneyi TaxID=208452 RepID=A0A1B1DYC7_9APIC|nr:ValS protein [Plasmodium coatneyi]ANQ07821.1 ValS protein [Plasmodium coatneyi]
MKALLPHLCIMHLCLTPSPVEGHTRRGLLTGANLSPQGGEIRPRVPVVVPNRVFRIRSVATQPSCCKRPSECPPVVTRDDSSTSERKSKRGRHPYRGSLHFVEGISAGVSPRLRELGIATAGGRRRKKKKFSPIYPTTGEKQLPLRLLRNHVLDSLTVCKNESISTTVALSGGLEKTRDLLEELYQRGDVRGSPFPKYAFFKNTDGFLGLEKIYKISRRRRWNTTPSWSSLLQENQLHKYINQIDDLKGLYSKELTASLYTMKQREEKRYLDRYSPSEYAKSFIFLFPPPNLSGELHAGHYFNFVQLHVLLLFSRHVWSKFSLPLYGADHGGLSAHAAFSRVANPKWTREKYISEINRWQGKLKEKILTCMQKMNIVVDRSRFYNTMDENMKQIVKDTFRTLYRNNFIVKKLYPVYYCPRLGTIVSKLDVEFREALHPKWRVTLRLVDGGEESHADTSSDSPHGDTPPGEKSKDKIGEQPNCKYTKNSQQTNEVKFFPQSSHHFFYLKSTHEVLPELTPSECIHVEVANLEELKKVVAILYFSPKKEKRYRGKYALLPLLNKGVPLICANERNVLPVLRSGKIQEGTLHEVGHGEGAGDVFIPVFSKEENFNHYANGTSYTDQSEALHYAKRGKHTQNSGTKNCQEEQGLLPLVEHLMESGLAKVVIPRETQLKCAFYKNNECVLTLAEQWCLDYEKLSKIFFDGPHGREKKSYRIIPSKYGDYFTGAFPPPSEWTLSRQVPYGHPVPLFKYEPPDGGVEKDALLGNSSCYVYGNDVDEAYHNLSKSKQFQGIQIRREFLKREEDVLDNWFSSSLYPLHCIKELGVDLFHFLRVRKSLVDFLLTGKDILQPWVVRSFVVLNYVMQHLGGDQNPEKSRLNKHADMKTDCAPPPLVGTVKFHGILKDQAGRKISKSETNATYYDSLVREANVDEVRLSFCFIQRDTEDVYLSENINRKSRKFLTKLWNIAKYIKEKCPPQSYEEMNRWFASTTSNPNLIILTHLEKNPHARISHIGTFRRYLQMLNSVLCQMKDYQVGKAINIIFNFVVNIFSKFYLTLHSGGYFKDGEDKLVSNVLPVYIFRGILKIIFPFVPHIAEVLFIRLFRKEQMDKVGKCQPPFNASTPLSSNYDLMKNEMLPPFEEKSSPLDKSFDVFMQLYTLLVKYKKEKYSHQGHTVHIYLKQNYDEEVPIEYFKNEEASLGKLLGENVRFSFGNESPLEGNPAAYPSTAWKIIHDDPSFTITVGEGPS